MSGTSHLAPDQRILSKEGLQLDVRAKVMRDGNPAASGEDRVAINEWRTGWPLPIVAGLGNAIGITHLYTLGIFIKPLETEFGWTRSEISSSLLIITVAMIFLGTFGGALIDRWGARRVALPGVVAFCATMASLSLAGSSILTWWALWIPIGIATVGVSTAVWTTPVTSRFDRTRGLALAITLCGGALSSTVLPIVAEYYVGQFGWRLAYVALAGTLLAIVLPLLLLFFFDSAEKNTTRRQAQRETRGGIDLRDALSGKFLRLVLISLCLVTALTALVVHLVPLFESKGLPRGTAAAAAGAIGIGSLIGRVAGGIALDHIRGTIVAPIIFSIPIVAAALLLTVDMSASSAILIAGLIGVSLGGEIDVLAYLTSRHFGTARFGTLFSILCIVQAVGVGLGPVIAGFIFDRSGSYDPLLMIAIPLFALAVVLAATLGRYPAEAAAE